VQDTGLPAIPGTRPAVNGAVTSEWRSSWAGVMHSVSQSIGYYSTTSSPGSRPNWGSTASSLPAPGGVMTVAELQAGVINHPLALALNRPKQGSLTWPAQRSDGVATGTYDVREGSWFRLNPAINVETLSISPIAVNGTPCDAPAWWGSLAP
jgi:hypothetical protein